VIRKKVGIGRRERHWTRSGQLTHSNDLGIANRVTGTADLDKKKKGDRKKTKFKNRPKVRGTQVT